MCFAVVYLAPSRLVCFFALRCHCAHHMEVTITLAPVRNTGNSLATKIVAKSALTCSWLVKEYNNRCKHRNAFGT
ncbi:hypothetical protein B0H63DRAFT_476044 [Podospora didyma]|uniref:Secreted protein n=1 Tax=Podospora didyma TaxID=330526 RepID=A0AAE0NHH3_9PEZI|nr:hypothetical protein B0H63DRAFT_476044 [Podospora didyma]